VQAVFPAPSEYVPAAQDVQALTRPTPKLPAGQAVHKLAPPTANQPSRQFVQLLARAPETVPFAQGSHVKAPLWLAGDENFPARQASHVVFLPSMVEAVPSSHRLQSRSVVLVQAMHPGNVLYLPAEHKMQGPPVGPHRPAMHEQFKRSQAKLGLYVPSEHWACNPP
jgi:hypothetical protein